MRKENITFHRKPVIDDSSLFRRGLNGRDQISEIRLPTSVSFATQQGHVLFSFNRGDFYQLHTQYLAEGKRHTGIILANQQQYSVGEAMRRILLLAGTKTHADMENWVEFLGAWGY